MLKYAPDDKGTLNSAWMRRERIDARVGAFKAIRGISNERKDLKSALKRFQRINSFPPIK